MQGWDVNLYLRFRNERTQPAIDLVSRIDVDSPKRIIDLGCGPGTSTGILRQRWPHAQVAALDSAPEMIDAARASAPHEEWILGDATAWQAATPFDIVFSNAALQWMADHERLLPRLLDQVAPRGALAFQIPARRYSLSHQLILEIADDVEWAPLTRAAKDAFILQSPSFYYDVLADKASRVEIWETEYYHVMEDHQAIINWLAGAAARPFLDALPTEQQKRRFLGLLSGRITESYRPQQNGKVLFPFRRLFAVAYRA